MRIQRLLENFIPDLNLYSIHTFNSTPDYITGMIELQERESGWRYRFDIEINPNTLEFDISEFEVVDGNDEVMYEPGDTFSQAYNDGLKESKEFVHKYIRAIVSRMQKQLNQ